VSLDYTFIFSDILKIDTKKNPAPANTTITRHDPKTSIKPSNGVKQQLTDQFHETQAAQKQLKLLYSVETIRC
jgi:hypothetical protein